MMYRLTAMRRRSENFPRPAIFPVRDANFVQAEDEFSHTLLDGFIQILDWDVLSRNTRGAGKCCCSCGTLFVWKISSGWRRINEFTQPRLIEALN
jgi:hypothetical protein